MVSGRGSAPSPVFRLAGRGCRVGRPDLAVPVRLQGRRGRLERRVWGIIAGNRRVARGAQVARGPLGGRRRADGPWGRVQRRAQGSEIAAGC